MALIVKDRVQETTTTTGTGTVTLAGAKAGFQSFAAIGNLNTTYYAIKSGNNYEVGLGTYTASGTTLSRDTVLESSAGGTTKITLAGTSDVFCTYPAEKAVVLDSSDNISGSNVVVTSNITDDAVTADKLANSINTEIAANTAKVTNATHTGDVTGATALTIANDAVTVDKLNLVSTASVPSLEAKGSGSQDGYIQLNCYANTHGIKLKSPPHSAGATYTLTFPNDDGDANEFLQTDGSGVLTWAEAGGASAGGAIYENANAITTNFTFATNKNGMSVSPITINAGVTVTVPSGQRWVVL